jgi:hypothetical protein
MDEVEQSEPNVSVTWPATGGQRVLVLLRPNTDSMQVLAALKPLYNMDIQTFVHPRYRRRGASGGKSEHFGSGCRPIGRAGPAAHP